MADVHLSEVSRRNPDGSWALSEFTLSIADGEIMVLTGPSGSGKTTTLRVVAGLEEPTSGTISVAGEVVNGIPIHARDVALVTQEHTLYPHLTVEENLRFALELRRTPAAEVHRRVDAEARVLKLGRMLKRLPHTLSAGHRQTAALGRATTRAPRVFLLDEPLHALDAAERTRVRSELMVFLKGMGVTTLYVTNDQIEAMMMGDRVAVLADGGVRQVGPPQELLDQPLDRFVAGFFGTPGMRFADALVEEQSGLAWYRLADQRLRIPAALPGPLRAWRDRTVVLGVRPWRLGDARAEPEHPADARLHAVVDHFERHGHEDLVLFTVGEDQLCARFPSGSAPPAGSPVEVTVDTNHLTSSTPPPARPSGTAVPDPSGVTPFPHRPISHREPAEERSPCTTAPPSPGAARPSVTFRRRRRREGGASGGSERWTVGRCRRSGG